MFVVVVRIFYWYGIGGIFGEKEWVKLVSGIMNSNVIWV